MKTYELNIYTREKAPYGDCIHTVEFATPEAAERARDKYASFFTQSANSYINALKRCEVCEKVTD